MPIMEPHRCVVDDLAQLDRGITELVRRVDGAAPIPRYSLTGECPRVVAIALSCDSRKYVVNILGGRGHGRRPRVRECRWSCHRPSSQQPPLPFSGLAQLSAYPISLLGCCSYRLVLDRVAFE